MTNKSTPIVYPTWAPTELCEYHKKWVTNSPDLKNEALRALEKLVTDKRMQPIWGKLEKLAALKNIDNYTFDLFILTTNTEGPYGVDRLTKRKLQDAVKKIEKKSSDLADLVDEVMPFAFINNATKSLDNLMIDVIRNLSTQAHQVLDKRRTLSNPGVKHAARNYFVRQLAAFFIETFDIPMLSTVAELHNIFMLNDSDINEQDNNSVIDEHDVASILRGSPLKPSHS